MLFLGTQIGWYLSNCYGFGEFKRLFCDIFEDYNESFLELYQKATFIQVFLNGWLRLPSFIQLQPCWVVFADLIRNSQIMIGKRDQLLHGTTDHQWCVIQNRSLSRVWTWIFSVLSKWANHYPSGRWSLSSFNCTRMNRCTAQSSCIA